MPWSNDIVAEQSQTAPLLNKLLLPSSGKRPAQDNENEVHAKKKRDSLLNYDKPFEGGFREEGSIIPGSTENAGNFFTVCCLCDLHFQSELELEEHLYSLLHHRALDTEKGKDFSHQCNLCHHKCKGLSEYVSHLRDEGHRKNVEKRRDDLEHGRLSGRVHSLIRYKSIFMYPPTKKVSSKDQPTSSMSSSMKESRSHNAPPSHDMGFQHSRSFSGRATHKKPLSSDEDKVRFSRPRNVYHSQNYPPSSNWFDEERRRDSPRMVHDRYSQDGFPPRFLHPESRDSFRGSGYHQRFLSSGCHDEHQRDHHHDQWHPAYRDEQDDNDLECANRHHGDDRVYSHGPDEQPHASVKSTSSESRKERSERYNSPLMRSYTNKPLRKFKRMLQRNIKKQSKENNLASLSQETPRSGPFSKTIKNSTFCMNWRRPLEVRDLHPSIHKTADASSKSMYSEDVSLAKDEDTRGFANSNRNYTKPPPTSRSTDDTVSSQAASIASNGKISLSSSTVDSVGNHHMKVVQDFTSLSKFKNPFHEDDLSLPTLTFSKQLNSATSFSRQTTSESSSATSLALHQSNQSSSSTSVGKTETQQLRNKFRSIMDEIDAPSSCRSISSSTVGSLVTSSDTARDKDSMVVKRHRPQVVADNTLSQQGGHSDATGSDVGLRRLRDGACDASIKTPPIEAAAPPCRTSTSDDDESPDRVREKLLLLAEKKQKETEDKTIESSSAEDVHATVHPSPSTGGPGQDASDDKDEGSESEDTNMCENNKKKLMPKPNIAKARSRLKTSQHHANMANSDSDGERKHSRMAKLLLTMGARTKTALPAVTVSPQRQAKLKIGGSRFGIGLPANENDPSDFSLDESDLQDIVMAINEAEGICDDHSSSTAPEKLPRPVSGGGKGALEDQAGMLQPQRETASPIKVQRSPGMKKYSKKRPSSHKNFEESSHIENSQGQRSPTSEMSRAAKKPKHKKSTLQPVNDEKVSTRVKIGTPNTAPQATLQPKRPNDILPTQNDDSTKVVTPRNNSLPAPILAKVERLSDVTMPLEQTSPIVIETSLVHPPKQKPITPTNASEHVHMDELSARLLHMSEREELLHSQDNEVKAQSIKLHDEMAHVDNLIEQLTLRKKELDEEVGKIDEEERRIKSDLESIRQHRLALLRGTVGSSIPPPHETPPFRPESCVHSTPTPSSNPNLTFNSTLPLPTVVHSTMSEPSNDTRYDTAMTFDLPGRDVLIKSEAQPEPELSQNPGTPQPSTDPFPVASSSVYFDSLANKAENKAMTSSINTILKKYLKDPSSEGEVTSSTTPQKFSTSSQDEVANKLPSDHEVTSTTLHEEPANRRLKSGRRPQPYPSKVDEGEVVRAPHKSPRKADGRNTKKKSTEPPSDPHKKQPSPNDVTKSWVTAHDVTKDSPKEVVPVKLTAEQLSIASLKASSMEPHSSSVLCLVVTDCGKIITSAKDKCLNISDIATGGLLKTYHLPSTPFKAFASAEVCADTKHSLVSVFLVFADDTVEHNALKEFSVHQLQIKMSNTSSDHSYQFNLTKLLEHDACVLFIHSWKELLYLSTKDGRVIIFNTATLKLVDTLDCHSPHAIHCLTTGTEGPRRVLCCGSSDCRVSVRDAEDGLLIKTLSGHSKTVNCLQLKGDLLYSGASDRTVLVHNIHTGDVTYRFLGMHSGSIRSLHVERNALVSLCLDKCVRVLRTEPCRVSGPPKAVSSPPVSMCVHSSNLDQYSGVMLPFAFVGCLDGAVKVIPLTQLAYKPVKPAGGSIEPDTDTSFLTDDLVKIDLIEGLDCLWSGCGAGGFTTGSALLTHINLFHATIYYKEALNSCCLWGDCTHYFSSDIDTALDVEVHMDKHVHDSVMGIRA